MRSTDDEALLAMFREESRERLDRAMEALLALKREATADDAVNAILLEVHSIKGAAGMLGLDTAASIADAMEAVLADARESGELAPGAVDPLLRASAVLRGAVNGEDVDPDETVSRLAAFRGGRPPAASSRP